MKKLGSLTLMVIAAVTLASCTSSGEQGAAAPPSTVNRAVSARNNNTDPYAGWVPKFNDTGNWYDTVFYRCDDNGTATYRTYDPAGGVDVEFNSPDCPAR